MNPQKYRGILTKWKDERGFGFIKPDTGTREVFLHITVLKGAGRRPRVGDAIYYELTTEANGKVRASNASIEGVASSSVPKKLKKKSFGLIPTVITVSVLAIIALFEKFTGSNSPSLVTSVNSPPLITSVPRPGCNIKGNISIETGNKIYHVPGAEDYESTIIDPIKGERWFCTESEAIDNGWRKAPR
ncbi:MULTISPECIES: cold-shock protein [unclassified Coleofasciculus]|uniref:cold-shock protein n=1 Tax=unclassified Coleofasciculus TaxID=2692782 RepID=UPI00188008F2|nr:MULTISPECIES: cold shock domain-containing protein [unclassified Coleofasciculus]MBE9124973.1 cold shock domain-containing protein [Coleofasciculus sp. LEGE 07081]MBE9147997.1 cold shock domain-containing protein [Coleofasciculus sp. LEGE 07092]